MLQETSAFPVGPKQILPLRDIHLWLTRFSSVNDAQLIRQYLSYLDAREIKRMNEFAFEKLRHQYLVTRALIKWLIARYTSLAIDDIRFEYNEFGRPQLPDALNCSGLKFNISHQGDYVLVGLTRRNEIGVDIEKIERGIDHEAIAREFFSGPEFDDLARLDSTRRLTQFYECWTLKESYIKARGRGLSMPLHEFSFHLGADSIRLSYPGAHEDDPDDWKFWLIDSVPDYRIAVAVLAPDPGEQKRLRFFNAVPLQKESEQGFSISRGPAARVSRALDAATPGLPGAAPVATSLVLS